MSSIDQAARAPLWVSYGYAAAVALGLAHLLLGIPIQLSDSYGNMLALETSWRDLLVGQFTQRAFLRPFLWAELKLIYDLAAGSYFEWFRGTHVVQVALLLVGFVCLVRPRSWRDAALVPLGLAALVGVHTFAGAVVEAFPINTFLTILLCCIAAAIISLSAYRWWNDLLAVLLFVVAALTVESGLLVWVIFIGGALVGARGVSRPALVVLALLLAAYFGLRFAWLDVGAPGLEERSSGWGFSRLDPTDLIARFDGNPLPFYAYNVATSWLSVVAAEPRAGVFLLIASVVHDDPQPSLVVNVIASVAGTLMLLWFAWERRRIWLARRFERDDQLVLLFAMVLTANAVISYPYTKDVIMSPAGMFFAIALYAALRSLIGAAGAATLRRGAVTLLVVVLAGAWSIRAAALHLQLRDAALKVKREWMYSEKTFVEESGPDGARARALREQLLRDVVLRPTPPPLDVPLGDWFERP